MEKIALSVAEAAAYIGVSKNLMYELVHRADFPSKIIGGRILISKNKLQEWLDKQ